MQHAGVVDQHVHPAQRGFGRFEQGVGLGGVGHVGAQRGGLAAGLADLRRQRFGGGAAGRVVDGHGVAVAGQAQRDRRADAA